MKGLDMKKVKLSKPQRELLEKAVAEGNTYAVDSYLPVKKLLALGYIEQVGSFCRWSATAEGRKALEGS